MKYKKKPVEIEAIQWTGDNFDEITRFCDKAKFEFNTLSLIIDTLEGKMQANKGDFIVKGVDGEFYPCEQNIFERTYETSKDISIGRWIYSHGDVGYSVYQCSVCKAEVNYDEGQGLFCYCPHCDAKMDGGVKYEGRSN